MIYKKNIDYDLIIYDVVAENARMTIFKWLWGHHFVSSHGPECIIDPFLILDEPMAIKNMKLWCRVFLRKRYIKPLYFQTWCSAESTISNNHLKKDFLTPKRHRSELAFCIESTNLGQNMKISVTVFCRKH